VQIHTKFSENMSTYLKFIWGQMRTHRKCISLRKEKVWNNSPLDCFFFRRVLTFQRQTLPLSTHLPEQKGNICMLVLPTYCCFLLARYQGFGETYCLFLVSIANKETIHTFELLAPTYYITEYHNSEDINVKSSIPWKIESHYKGKPLSATIMMWEILEINKDVGENILTTRSSNYYIYCIQVWTKLEIPNKV
jgi:hypothetical protein